MDQPPRQTYALTSVQMESLMVSPYPLIEMMETVITVMGVQMHAKLKKAINAVEATIIHQMSVTSQLKKISKLSSS